MRDVFERIYRNNEWGCGSGEGSFPEHTTRYAAFLERFVRERGVRSVLDVGCGDWQFSRSIDWGAASYVGMDVVASVIEANTREFARPASGARGAIVFRLYDGDPGKLPAADLLIVKDVLQHWSNAAVMAFLPVVANYRYALITNCISPSRKLRVTTGNRDIADGEMRHLDLRRPPFGLKARALFTFTNHRPGPLGFLRKPRWRKLVLLCERDK